MKTLKRLMIILLILATTGCADILLSAVVGAATIGGAYWAGNESRSHAEQAQKDSRVAINGAQKDAWIGDCGKDASKSARYCKQRAHELFDATPEQTSGDVTEGKNIPTEGASKKDFLKRANRNKKQCLMLADSKTKTKGCKTKIPTSASLSSDERG